VDENVLIYFYILYMKNNQEEPSSQRKPTSPRVAFKHAPDLELRALFEAKKIRDAKEKEAREKTPVGRLLKFLRRLMRLEK
jgi:hypothetical protein